VSTAAPPGRAAHADRATSYLHPAVDDHSRLAYSELLTDERQETAAAFWTRAHAYFARCGITVRRVLTDNGSCYRSRVFAAALGDIAHKRTRPYRPATNGKVERFHRTLNRPGESHSRGMGLRPLLREQLRTGSGLPRLAAPL
jgi:transposase InsO family protein